MDSVKTPIPSIDERKQRTLAELEAGLADVAASPKDNGTVCLLMGRLDKTHRMVHSRVMLTEAGMPDDRWTVTEHGTDDMLAVMCEPVTQWIANGQSQVLFGDNLSLDLDLSVENLPIGSTVRVGQALTEVTPKEHNGCSLYADRFGADALRFISAQPRRALRLRGIYLRVIEPGEVKLGDKVVVVSRPQA